MKKVWVKSLAMVVQLMCHHCLIAQNISFDLKWSTSFLNETTPISLNGGVIIISNSSLFISNPKRSNLFVLSLKDGKYEKSILSKGKGPGEFQDIMSGTQFNENSKTIFYDRFGMKNLIYDELDDSVVDVVLNLKYLHVHSMKKHADKFVKIAYRTDNTRSFLFMTDDTHNIVDQYDLNFLYSSLKSNEIQILLRGTPLGVLTSGLNKNIYFLPIVYVGKILKIAESGVVEELDIDLPIQKGFKIYSDKSDVDKGKYVYRSSFDLGKMIAYTPSLSMRSIVFDDDNYLVIAAMMHVSIIESKNCIILYDKTKKSSKIIELNQVRGLSEISKAMWHHNHIVKREGLNEVAIVNEDESISYYEVTIH